MGNNKQPQTVNIDGTEHDIESFTQEQRVLLEHCMDLDRKLASCMFQADQLRVGKDAFLAALKRSLVVSKALAESESASADAT